MTIFYIFDEMGKVLHKGSRCCEKKETARYEQFFIFSKDFYCRHIKTWLVWETVRFVKGTLITLTIFTPTLPRQDLNPGPLDPKASPLSCCHKS